MMANARLLCVAAIFCLMVSSVRSVTSEKQIKLEDIEKDNLKAAHQAKIEKQIQEQQQQLQQQQYYQAALQYTPHQKLAFQNPSAYLQYIVPQQYIPQTSSRYFTVPGYAALSNKNVAFEYTTPSSHAFQAYFRPDHLTSVSPVTSFQSGNSLESASQTQPILMAFISPQALQQQQQYYQGPVQYYPTQSETVQYYYSPQVVDQSSSAQFVSAGGVLPGPQHYYTYQPSTDSKQTAVTYQYVSTAAKSLPTPTYSSQVYQPQTTHSTNAANYAKLETPTFVSIKAPQSLVATSGQKQQFAQSQSTTLSPLQTKYLNSPQYLAQNYNTIQSSELYPKSSFTSGIKSTVSPPLKFPTISSVSSSSKSNAFIGNSYGSASNSFPVIQSIRSLPVKSYTI